MSGREAALRRLSPAEWRQLGAITLGAAVVFLALRFLPTGTNLNHMDFRVDAKNAIEFCDPLNPQFIPVVAVKSPVTLRLATENPPVAGREVRATVTLRTASEKPIAPADLLVAHTRKLHLLIVDPTLTDYQHVHPEPAAPEGAWTFAFTPRRSGAYRIFADFTPAATARGLYASADFDVGAEGAAVPPSAAPPPAAPSLLAPVEQDGFVFTLQPAEPIMRAGRTVELTFAVQRRDEAAVPLQPVMGAFAHLVAFDRERSGFAHLHPTETDLTRPPNATRPELHFKVTIPRAGRYVIWAQANLGGREVFVPFWFEVQG